LIGSKSLALYKNRPVLVVEAGDKLEIKLQDGSSLRVREKDLEPLHAGPVAAIPSKAEGGDFETARAMGAGSVLSYAELAELVFGSAGPAEVLACWAEGVEGSRFRPTEGGLSPLSDEEVAKEAEKRQKKEGEAAQRNAFIEKAKRARAKRAPGEDAQEPAFGPEDERFLAEIEAFALGKSQKCRLSGEIGFTETPEAAQGFLLASGRWDETVNPHPSRAGCPLYPPKYELSPDREAPARVDLRAIPSWAIDNAWSQDPDDAIGYDSGFVYVSVADPAASILPGTPIDKEALGRGSTLYMPEGISPLLPDAALERYGLGLAPSSPALTFKIGLDAEGAIASVETFASTLSVRRTHYAAADELMERGEAPDLVELSRIAAIRQARRVEAGAVEIEIPEVRVYVRGKVIKIERLPKTRASGLVREIMLLAGEAVARWAFERRLAFPFYGQEAPADSGEAARGSGLSAEFAKRRLMRGGILGPTPTAHRGLGLPFYAQVTSPLRRYQDLLGHMQIRALLEGREPLDADEVARRCALAQAGQSATRQAERGSELHWTLAYLKQHPDWTGEGIIVGQIGSAAYQVYLPELGLEAKLKLGPGRELDETLALRLARVDLATLESSFDEVEARKG
jgi:exoribonuclease II